MCDDETPTTQRRDKPQTLAGIEATKSLSGNSNSSSATQDAIIAPNVAKSAAVAVPTATANTFGVGVGGGAGGVGQPQNRFARNRARMRALDSLEREHSCDGIMSTTSGRYTAGSGVGIGIGSGACSSGSGDIGSGGSGSDGGSSTAGNDDLSGSESTTTTQRRESLNFDEHSPSGQSLNKALFGRSLRYSSGVAGGGPTTRKCVLTLDGYSYVIVASTPENLPKRDETNLAAGGNNSSTQSTSAAVSATAASGSALNAGNTVERRLIAGSATIGGGGGAAATTPASGDPNKATHSPTTTGFEGISNIAGSGINGQVARHGSLTIVRRSNSRKSFAQIDAQQTLLTSPGATQTSGTFFQQTTATSSGTTSVGEHAATPHPAHTPLNQCATTSGAGHSNGSNHYKNQSTISIENSKATTAELLATKYYQTASEITATDPASTSSTGDASTANNYSRNSRNKLTENNLTSHSPPATGIVSATATALATAATSYSALSSNVNKMQPSSPNLTNFNTEPKTGHASSQQIAITKGDVAGDSKSENPQKSCERNCEAESQDISIAWGTEALPSVDTPDALNKAALRIRTLLRRMDSEHVSYEDMQRNLHYAARVLEAVFLDESRSPTSGKIKLGQIATSSVESEDVGQPQITNEKVENCNGNCKNLNCNQHSHSSCTPAVDSAEQELVPVLDNNNINSSCSLANAAVDVGSEICTEAVTLPDEMQPQTEEPPIPDGTETATTTPPPQPIEEEPDEGNETQQLNATDNQEASIESRTKGVTEAPQTHSGPTGPPQMSNEEPTTKVTANEAELGEMTIKTVPALDKISESVLEEQMPTTAISDSAVTSITTAEATATSTGDSCQSVVAKSSSSSSNKAADKRQKRIRFPDWARTMSTNKTYIKS